MTIGIYALWWAEQDLIYVGQSQNIENRFREHCYKLSRKTHTNYKVQACYENNGLPELVILEICSTGESNNREIFWTKEFNSIDTGLNIIEAGKVGFGVNSNASKYTKWQILKVFSTLYRTNLTYTEIATKLKVSVSLVAEISNQSTHTWLNNQYPIQYLKMASKVRKGFAFTRKSRAIIEYQDGSRYSISNAQNFCKEHPILKVKNTRATAANINRLIRGDLKSYIGFKLVKS